MIIRCKYCDTKCRPAVDTHGGQMWQCDYHGATLVRYYLINEDQFTTCYLIHYKNDTYYMWFLPFNEDIKFRIDKVNYFYQNRKMWPFNSQAIVSLNFVPNIRPEEAIDKLTTYIMFS